MSQLAKAAAIRTAPAEGPAVASRPAAQAASEDGERDALVGTLARGLAVLEVMLAARQPLSLAEIATLANLEQSTTLRLLRALEDSAFVVRNPVAKKYSPSPKAIHPLALLNPVDQLRRETGSVVRELANELRQTIVFVLFLGYERMVLEIAQTPGSLSPFYDTWLRGPLHGSGGGKSLLLTLRADERRALLGAEPFEAWTANTLRTWTQLDADLALSAERGYVVARDEQRLGVTAIGAPVRTWTGATAGCLVTTALSRELDAARTAWCGEQLRHAAQLLLYQAPSLGAAALLCGR
ncbi:IclR family transcriptional regulator C-terminal domain-containing protein [Paraburkholderia fungorum]|uniref:IclR family transcriptional regulator n=1 Tax=Paraburkholderia fungorum TaxID=134537 RepID=UPI0038BDE8FE